MRFLWKDSIQSTFTKGIGMKLMILLLFAGGIFFTVGSLNYYFAESDALQGFSSVYTSVKHLRPSVADINISNVTASDAIRIQSLNRDLRQSTKFSAFQALVDHPFFILNFKGSDNLIRGYTSGSLNKGIKLLQSDGSHVYASDVNSMLVSPNFFTALKIKMGEGNDFSSVDCSYVRGKVYPAVLGSHYKGYYKIGDRFEADPFLQSPVCPVTYEVVGFIEDNEAVIPFNANTYNNEKLLSLDDMILTPLFNFTEQSIADSASQKAAVLYSAYTFTANIISTTLPHDEIQSSLNAIYSQHGFSKPLLSEVMTVSPVFQSDMNHYFQLMLLCALTILTFSVFSLSVNMMNQLMANLRRYVVHLISGATLKDVCYSMFFEVLLMLLFADGIALTFIGLFGRKVFSYTQTQIFSVSLYGFSKTTLLCVIMVNLLVLLISLAAPILRLHSIEYDTMLRGRE